MGEGEDGSEGLRIDERRWDRGGEVGGWGNVLRRRGRRSGKGWRRKRRGKLDLRVSCPVGEVGERGAFADYVRGEVGLELEGALLLLSWRRGGRGWIVGSLLARPKDPWELR